MRVTRLAITNYRSFGPITADISLPDLRQPISIIGSNNAGKSNLIGALLHVVGVRSSYPSTFQAADFHGGEPSVTIHVAADIDPPLYSSNAFNVVTAMPRLDLKIKDDGGGVEVSHYCCDEFGKQVFNARAIKRSKSKAYSTAEREALTEYQRSGAEQVYKWRSKIPVHYLGPETIQRETSVNRLSLLGKLVDTFLADFRREDNLMEDVKGVHGSHVGKSRLEIYNSAMAYLEQYVLATPQFKGFVSRVEQVLREQLEIDGDGFEVRFGREAAALTLKGGPADMVRLVRTLRGRRGAMPGHVEIGLSSMGRHVAPGPYAARAARRPTSQSLNVL